MSALETSLPPVVSDKSVLVRMDTVQTVRGLDAETINGLVDEGKFLWVFDFNNGVARTRQLRFLALEVFKPEVAQRLSLDGALRIILGETRATFRGADIASRLRVSRPSVHRFHRKGNLAGTISGNTFRVTRGALETFLRKHWIGGAK